MSLPSLLQLKITIIYPKKIYILLKNILNCVLKVI